MKELRTLLKSKDSVASIERLMLGSGPEVHDVVRSLYSALLRLAREESDNSTLVECAACLGELGAVDPSRLRLSTNTKRTFLYVSEREAREFQSYLYFTSSREYQLYHSNHCDFFTARKSLEYQRSNTHSMMTKTQLALRARTQVQHFLLKREQRR